MKDTIITQNVRVKRILGLEKSLHVYKNYIKSTYTSRTTTSTNLDDTQIFFCRSMNTEDILN